MSATPTTIYLASKSPRRRELLHQISVPFELLLLRETPVNRASSEQRRSDLSLANRCDVDESPLANELPRDYVERVVKLKATVAHNVMLARKLVVRPILSADTTVVLNDKIIGKPIDAADAAATLRALSGQTHQVMTGIALHHQGTLQFCLSVSDVCFKTLTEAEIQRFILTGEPMDKAGSYGVQGRAAAFVAHLSGSYSGVMGLPLHETSNLLGDLLGT
jgi:septum formation protein